MLKFIITLFCVALVLQDVSTLFENKNDCFTPDKNYGTCINLKSCESLKRILIKRKKTSEEIDFLKSSMCGYDDALKDPKVCCPFQSLCGQNKYGTTERIIGGRNSTLGDWPWMVVLGIRNTIMNDTQWICGGALISNRFVLTAAHCTHKIEVNVVRLGELNLNPGINDGANPEDISIARIIKHQQYNPTTVTNDIALLKLEKTVTYNDFIQPICLPIPPLFINNSLYRKEPTVAGWGATKWMGSMTDALMEVTVSVYDDNHCKRIIANESKVAVIDKRTICAGDYINSNKDSCQGDSGGPLMWPKYGQYYIVGIVSYGFQCAKEDVPGIYTRVSTFIDWITDNMKKNLKE